MKKYLLVLLAALGCGSTGCNTDIEPSNIADLINDENRCAITGGIQITSEQAKVIESMVTVINTKDCWDKISSPGMEELKTACPPLSDLRTKLAGAGESFGYTFSEGLVNIKRTLNGAFLEYHTRTMADIFEFVSQNVSMVTSQNLFYCACDYEFCDDNTACVTDPVSQLPTCAVSKYAATTNENQCDPITLKGNKVLEILETSTLPIVKKLEEINKKGKTLDLTDKVFSNWCILDYSKVEDPSYQKQKDEFLEHCKAQNGYGYLFSNTCESPELKHLEANCKLAQSLFSYLFNCLNENDPELCPKDLYSPLIVPGLKNVNYSASYYTLIRSYVEEMLTTDLEDTLAEKEITLAELKNSKEFVRAVDEFIINEAIYIVNAPGNIYNIEVKDSTTVADFLNATNNDGTFCQDCISELQPDEIILAVRKVLDTLYSDNKPITIPYKGGIQTIMPDNEMRRKLFAYIPLAVMPKDTLSSSFSTNLQCISVTSAIGDPTGIKKYCAADDNQLIGAEQIFAAINGDELIARVDFFDAYIMGTDAKFKVNLKDGSGETTDVVIHTGSTSNIISFTNTRDGNKTEYLKGKWTALKCPNGASCSDDTTCGICANSDIPHTIYAYTSDDSSDEDFVFYEDAICKNGKIQ